MLKDKITITYNLDEVADTIEEGIRFLKEHNISSAEVRTIDGKNIAKLTLEETLDFKNKLHSHGISISSIASPLFKWYSGDSKHESEADLFGMSPYLSDEEKKLMIEKLIDQACVLETTKIRIFSGLKPDKKKHSFPKVESDLLIYALQRAKEKGVQLLLENEPVCYISELKNYIDIFTSGTYEGLRAWFDVANIYEENGNISISDLKTLAPFIDYLHIKDPIAPEEHKYVSLGQGFINYKRIFDILEKVIENPVHLSIETHVKSDKWSASHASLDYLHKLLTVYRTKYALVGTGRISQKHFRAIKENENCTLIGVYDIQEKKSQKTAYEHDCTEYDSYEDLLEDEFVDVVSICTPHNTHIDLATKVIKKGKRVLCEKPLALSSKELEDYISNDNTNDKTSVVLQHKFNPAIKKFYEFEKEQLGIPQYIAMTLRWWRDPDYYKDWHGDKKVSGGPLLTQAIHSLELVTHLTKGSSVKDIKAVQIKTREEITLPDIIVAIIQFENGIVCNLEVCLATRNQNLESSIFVVGSKGSMKVGGVALSEFIHPKNEKITSEDYDGYGDGHIALYRTHSNHCLGKSDKDKPLLTKPSDVLNPMRLIEQIEDSFR